MEYDIAEFMTLGHGAEAGMEEEATITGCQ